MGREEEREGGRDREVEEAGEGRGGEVNERLLKKREKNLYRENENFASAVFTDLKRSRKAHLYERSKGGLWRQ